MPLWALLLALLSACTTVPSVVGGDADSRLRPCFEWFAGLDAAVARAGMTDVQEARIAGHPHLRTNRYTAALARDTRLADADFEREALPAMRALDRAARVAELSNMPAAAFEALATSSAEAVQRSEDCAAQLLNGPGPARRGITVPDSYSTVKRVLGAYAIARVPFTAGVHHQLALVRDAFARPLATPIGAQVLRYVPAEAAPDGADAHTRLLDQHQPIFDKEVSLDDDRPGALAWNAALGMPVLQRERPAVYRHVTYTRYRGRTLPQLVYTVWFGARPSEGPLDLLAGHLDGLIWRVTLDPRGRVLVYDTVHPCGCYHYFITTPRALLVPAPADEPEWAFVPQTLAMPKADQRAVLRIATRTQFLERVTLEVKGRTRPEEIRLQSMAQDDLRALPVLVHGGSGGAAGAGAATHSAYGDDGLVPGTQRAERFLFWPMGISSPGQMRQWGHHATAFVGRRHFDDADLFEKRFVFVLDDDEADAARPAGAAGTPTP